MDTKTVLFGIAVVVASVGGSAVVGGGEETKEVAVAAADKPAYRTAATIANLPGGVAAEKHCKKERVGTVEGIKLKWCCDGACLGEPDQAELDKLAGEDATSIVFTPVDDGKGGKELKPLVTTGEPLPNLDPVPEPVVEEVKEIEKP
jgi:hypothetical protein